MMIGWIHQRDTAGLLVERASLDGVAFSHPRVNLLGLSRRDGVVRS